VSCADLVRHLSDYIDGLLAVDVRASLEAHLADCDRCHLVLDTTQCTILLYRAAESPSLGADRRRALLQRLEKACRSGEGPA
jgi:anti-sigma factor RsiW